MKTIIHCLPKYIWNELQNHEYYTPNTIDEEGFIHCSDVETFHLVADFMFKDVKEPLVLLCIDSSKVDCEVIWEDIYNARIDFPHIYGSLNLNSVTSILPFLRDSNGKFVLNEELK